MDLKDKRVLGNDHFLFKALLRFGIVLSKLEIIGIWYLGYSGFGLSPMEITFMVT